MPNLILTIPLDGLAPLLPGTVLIEKLGMLSSTISSAVIWIYML